jgi:large subunit ribosomal protein L4
VVAAPKAPLLDSAGKKSKDLTLEAGIFGAEVKPHLVHETVRAELAGDRAGTRAVKSRGLVAGGRGKPWRQKGTGRARAGTIRAPQFTGGGVAFPPTMRSFEVKVNRKARQAAFRAALSQHAARGSLAFVDGGSFAEPSTKAAKALLAGWGQETPVLVVAAEAEEALIKSFRNLERVLVTVPSELEVAQLVWATSLLVTQSARPLVEIRAAQPPVRASGPREGVRGNRVEVPPTTEEGDSA